MLEKKKYNIYVYSIKRVHNLGCVSLYLFEENTFLIGNVRLFERNFIK